MTEKKTVYIGLLGLGTVGFGVYKTLQLQKDEMEQKIGSRIVIKRILVLKIADFADKVPDPSILTESADDILNDDEIDIVIEVIGGTKAAYAFQKKALEKGKHVVTANKDLIATKGEELVSYAADHKLDYMFEAAVGGGIPIIQPLREGLIGNNITEILGIVNGTTNFILTKMLHDHMGYEEALKIASDLGYAEANPTNDVEGIDAARKVAIMASLSFHSNVVLDDVYHEGITKIKPEDIVSATDLGCVIKLVGITRLKEGKIEACVYPMLIPEDHPMATVDDAFNAVFLHGDAVDDVMLYGRGAGEMPTASAIVGDLFGIVRDINLGCTGRLGSSCYKKIAIRPIDDIENKFYLSLVAVNKVGVLEMIASVFAKHNVSIASFIQKEKKKLNDAILVLTTEEVVEKDFRKSLDELRKLDIVRGISSVIRVY